MQSDRPGLFCNLDGICTLDVCAGQGTPITLTPAPQTGYLFDGWGGEPECGEQITLDESLTCAARFVQPEIEVTVTGSGKVLVPPNTEPCREGSDPTLCTAAVNANSYVTLTATPDPVQHLRGWGGEGCSGKSGSTIQVAMDDDKVCTAEFSSVEVGSGSGVVEIVSLADDESYGNNHVDASRFDALAASADLSVVGFASGSSNLLTGAPVPAEAGSTFARSRSQDPSLATTQQISPPQNSNFLGETRVSLSADGRYAVDAYRSGSPTRSRVFRRDLSTGVSELISTAYPAEVYEDRGLVPKISGNGRYVAYRGQIVAFPANPALGSTDGVIVRDTCTGAPPAEACTPRSVGVSRRNHPTAPYYALSAPAWLDISSDGRYVLFNGSIPGIGGTQIFLHDRDSDGNGVYDEAGATSTVAAVSSSDAYQWPFFLDASGRYVVFHSVDPSLPDNADAPYTGRAFLRDTCPTWASTPCMPDQLLSVDKYGQPLGPSFQTLEGPRVTDVSAAGRYVAFSTDNHLMFADEEPEEYQPVAVVRDTCLGAVLPCNGPTNRLVSLRTDGQLISFGGGGSPLGTQLSDDGTLAALFGPRNTLIEQPNGGLIEVLLSVTGFAPDEGVIPSIKGRYPTTATAGPDGGFLLTVFGGFFLPGAQVTWNNEPRRTIFVSDRKLQVWLEDEDLDQPGSFLLRVVNPGGRTSTPVSFLVGS